MTNQTLGVVFPGQGSQSVGMLSDIAAQFPEVNAIFDEASAALDYNLWEVVSEGPKEKLDMTFYTQPALLAASYAIWKILTSRIEIKPLLLAGHSLGEYTALVCANALDFQDALKLVAARGFYMQEAVPSNSGAMAAIIGLEDAEVALICSVIHRETNAILSPANYNSLGQVVIAGEKEAVEKAIAVAKEKGAKMAVLIPISVPSHCELMRPAAERLSELMRSITFNKPSITVINNVDVVPYTDPYFISQSLSRQLVCPVRWVETIQLFVREGITTILECGPGKVLTGLNKRIDKSLSLFQTADLGSLEALLKSSNERSV